MATDELYVKIGQFVGQAIVGIQLSLFQSLGIPVDDQSRQAINNRIILLVDYLNKCWISLILDNDPYISNTIREIIEFIPNESPACLFQLFLNVSQIAIPLINIHENIVIFTPVEERIRTNMSYLIELQDSLLRIYSSKTKDMVKRYFEERGEHTCIGPRYSEIRLQSPTPLWHIRQ